MGSQTLAQKQWYLRNRDIVLLRSKNWRLSHPEQTIKTKHICYMRRKDEISSASKKYHHKIRKQLYEILGGAKCNNCGFDIIEALQFDHINGGGTNERKRFGKSLYMYRFYINNPVLAKQKLQVLCANCNFIKHLHGERGEQL